LEREPPAKSLNELLSVAREIKKAAKKKSKKCRNNRRRKRLAIEIWPRGSGRAAAIVSLGEKDGSQ